MLKPITVVIIDDNKEIRSLMRAVLEEEKDINLCAEASNLEQAKDVLHIIRPDTALLDISIGGEEGGLAFMRKISDWSLPTQVIILSAHPESQYSQKSLNAGAKGYICKDKAMECLATAIRTVQSGNKFVSS